MRKGKKNSQRLCVSAVNPVALAKKHLTAERETRMGGGRFEGAKPLPTANARSARRFDPGGAIKISGRAASTQAASF